jgi:hypothetical protein
MLPSQKFLTYWYYYLPDLVMAALIYLLVARLLLSLLPSRVRDGVIGRLLDMATGPVLWGVGAVTPRVVPAGLVVVFALAWLLAARLVLFIAVAATGARLSMV